jgi:hypothetical protein
MTIMPDAYADARMHRKMAELASAVDAFQSVVDAHFYALQNWRRG